MTNINLCFIRRDNLCENNNNNVLWSVEGSELKKFFFLNEWTIQIMILQKLTLLMNPFWERKKIFFSFWHKSSLFQIRNINIFKSERKNSLRKHKTKKYTEIFWRLLIYRLLFWKGNFIKRIMWIIFSSWEHLKRIANVRNQDKVAGCRWGQNTVDKQTVCGSNGRKR